MTARDDALFLCLDQGGSASRALVFDARGNAVAASRVEVAHQRPKLGWVEQNASEVVASLRNAAEAAITALTATQRTALQACSLVCQRSSLLAWDAATGAAITPILSWQDVRAAAWFATQALDDDTLHAATGLYPNAHFGLSKLRWLLDHDAAVQQTRDAGRLRFGPLAAFLVQSLLEEQPFVVDPANASRTLLLDLGSNDWNAERLQQFGIERAWLPQVMPSDALFGHLAVGGLRLPLRLLSGDQSTAAFAFGEPQPDIAYTNLGTGAFVYRPTNTPVRLPRLLCSLIHGGRTPRYAVEGTVNGAGSALAWYAEEYGVDNVEALLDRSWNDVPPLFLNGVGGLGAPDWRADFPSRFVGDGDLGARAVAVAESVVFLLARNLDAMRALAPPLQAVVVSGGLAGSDPLCQRLADVVRLPVQRPAHCEASARGSAYLLAHPSAEWAPLPMHTFAPQPHPALQARHDVWRAAMTAALAGK